MRSCREADAGTLKRKRRSRPIVDVLLTDSPSVSQRTSTTFKDAEKRLRNDPNDIDPAVRELLQRCVPQ